MQITSLVTQYLTSLFEKKDIHQAMWCCTDDIQYYGTISQHISVGRDAVLTALAQICEMMTEEYQCNITNLHRKSISKDVMSAFVEYDLIKQNGGLFMRCRMTATCVEIDNKWKIKVIHTSSYEIQKLNIQKQAQELFYEQHQAFLGTDISFWYYDIQNELIIHDHNSVEVHGFQNIVEDVPNSLVESGYVHPDSVAEFNHMYECLRKGEERVSGEFWIRPKHSSQYWCERINYTIIATNEGKPVLAMGISKDVTAEKIWETNSEDKTLNQDCYVEENHNHNTLEQTRLLRMENEKLIRTAVNNNEFVIFLQPKVNSMTNSICGAESLIRWIHPKQGFISPGAFIPKLEAMRLMHILDLYSIERVCNYQKDRSRRNMTMFPISCNLSVHSLMDRKIIQNIIDIVGTVGISEELLIIEVTETAFASNQQIILEHIRVLQSHGIKVSMDDFGCGNSSFAQLATIPVDEIKLDMQLVQNAVSSIRGNAVLLSIVKLAEWLNLPIVAEGTETIEQVEYLQQAGCGICQGYYYSKPLSIVEFEQFSLFSYNTVEG